MVFEISSNYLVGFSNTIKKISSTNTGLHTTVHTHFILFNYFIFVLLHLAIPITMLLQVRNTFPSIQAAKDTIKTALAEAQESWKTTHSDKTRFNIIRKDTTCHFCIQVA